MSNADTEVRIECHQQYSCRNYKSIATGVYLNKLKLAKTVPIFKADDITDPSNYRPIYLLSNVNSTNKNFEIWVKTSSLCPPSPDKELW